MQIDLHDLRPFRRGRLTFLPGMPLGSCTSMLSPPPFPPPPLEVCRVISGIVCKAFRAVPFSNPVGSLSAVFFKSCLTAVILHVLRLPLPCVDLC